MPPQPQIRDLATFFENPFLSPRITFLNLRRFSEDHLARLSGHPIPTPDGTAILADTATKHTAYFGAINDANVAAAVREGLTVAVDNKLQEFKDLVKKRQKLLASTFVDNPEIYEQFFPAGLEEYTRASKTEVPPLMNRMSQLTAANNTLPASVGQEFAQIESQYQTMRNLQLDKKGDVSDSQDTKDTARTALADQLWANLHYIAYHFRGDVLQCMAYYDQSFLRAGADSGDDDGPQPGDPFTPDNTTGGGGGNE